MAATATTKPTPGQLVKREMEQCKSGDSKCRVCQEAGLPEGAATIRKFDPQTHKRNMRVTIGRFRWTTGRFAERRLIKADWHYHPCLYPSLFAFAFI